MNTRTAEPGAEFRQERYMSSAHLQTGLLANCVASRVRALQDPLHRKLIWFLQKLSYEPGGLERAAEEILSLWPDRFVTRAMRTIGKCAGESYTMEQARSVALSFGAADSTGWHAFFCATSQRPRREDPDDWLTPKWERKEQVAPGAFYVHTAVEHCRDFAARCFGQFLFDQLCLDPATALGEQTLWYLPDLVCTLSDYHEHCTLKAARLAPLTELGENIAENLDFALESRGLVVIDGPSRTGKTFAVRQWCEAHPGEARYFQVPSSNDDMSFFRSLCEALGLGHSRAYKANELRSKIEDVLQTGDLLLVMDEGHFLWPQRNIRNAKPHRIEWMRTQLVNMGVPVAVVTTPQFTKSQAEVERGSGWSSEQLIGRILHYEQLPATLSNSDLESVARHWLPDGDDDQIRFLCAYALSSQKLLQGIEALVKRARFMVRRAGRELLTLQDLAGALTSGVVPSDTALISAIDRSRPGRPPKRLGKASAKTLQPKRIEPKPGPTRAEVGSAERSTRPAPALELPARDTGSAVVGT